MAKKKAAYKAPQSEEGLPIMQEPELQLPGLKKSLPSPKIMPAATLLNNRRPAGHMTAMEKLERVKKGITKDELELLKENAGLDYDTLAQGLATARATLINVKGKDKFNFAVSEKIVGLDDIYSYGYEVFGDKEKFNRWMFRPNKALGNHTPFDLVYSQFGREEVKNLVGRIEYGIYA